MIEIAHVLRKLSPQAWGGTETHLAEVNRRLPGLGFAPRVFAPGAGEPGELGGAEVERFGAFCPYVGSRSARRRLVAMGGNLISLDLPWRLARRPAGVIHAHTGRRIAGEARLAASLRGMPFVVSVHGPLLADEAAASAEQAERSRGALDLGKPFGLLVGARSVLERADRVICFNEAERAALACKIGDRAVRMDHGVDAARLRRGDRARARARWGALGRGPVVTVLGRLSRQKNQLLALEAFARGAPGDAVLALAGAETDEGYQAEIQRRARALGVEGRVWLAGNLRAQDEVPDLLAASSLVVMPSVQEAFGIAVVEAWAAGVPALFSATSGTEALAAAQGVGEARVGSFAPEAWASALARALGDEGLRGRMIEAGREQVERRFSWDRVAFALAALYEQVLAGRGAR